MKKLAIALMAMSLFLTVACAKKPATPPPAPPTGCLMLANGTCDPVDVTTYRVINDAHAFLKSIHDSVTAGSLTLTASQKKIFNDLVKASNTADALWKLYHAGNSFLLPQLTSATNALNAALGTATAQIGSGQ